MFNVEEIVKLLIIPLFLVLCGCATQPTTKKPTIDLNEATIQAVLGDNQQKAIVFIGPKQITTNQTNTPTLSTSQWLNPELLQALKKQKERGKTQCLLAPSPDAKFGHFISTFYTCGQVSLLPNQLAYTDNTNKVKLLPLRLISMDNRSRGDEISALITITARGYAINIGRRSVFVPPIKGCPTDGPTVCYDQTGKSNPNRLIQALVALQKDHPKANWQFSLTASSTHKMKDVVDVASQIHSKFNKGTGFFVVTDAFRRREVYDKTIHTSAKLSEVRNFCDKDNIREVFRAKAPEIQKCIDDHINSSPSIAGKWIVSWRINLDQSITKASIAKRPNKTNEAFEQCLIKTVQSMKFERPDGGICIVNYPIRVSQ